MKLENLDAEDKVILIGAMQIFKSDIEDSELQLNMRIQEAELHGNMVLAGHTINTKLEQFQNDHRELKYLEKKFNILAEKIENMEDENTSTTS